MISRVSPIISRDRIPGGGSGEEDDRSLSMHGINNSGGVTQRATALNYFPYFPYRQVGLFK